MHLRRQPHLDRGRHGHRQSEDVVARYEAYGWHVQRVDWRDRPTATTRTSRRCTTRSRPPRPSPTGRRSSRCARSSAGRRRTSRTPARRTARRSATTRSRRPRRSSASTRTQTFPVDDEVLSHAREVAERGKALHAEWDAALRRLGRRPTPSARRCSTGCPPRELPDGWADALPDVPRRPQGHRHPQGLRRGAHRARAGAARAVGRLGRPGRVQQHDDGGRAVLPPGRTGSPRCGRATRTAARCTSASASTPWAPILNGIALHGGTRPYGGTFLRVQRLHARRRAAGRADGAAGHLRLDARLDRPRRGRPDAPAGRAPVVAAATSPAWTSSARPTPTRRRSRGGRSSSTPTGPAGLCLTRQNVPTFDRAKFALGRGRRARRVRARRATAAARHPDRHRLRGAARRRRPGAARGRGHLRPGGVDAVRGVVRRNRTRPTGRRCSRRRCGPGSRSRRASLPRGRSSSATPGE